MRPSSCLGQPMGRRATSRTSKSLISEFGFAKKPVNFRCKTSKTTCLVLPDAKGSHSGAMRPR